VEICCQFNGNNKKINCSDCKDKHVFRDLYKLGLLGTVEYDSERDKYKQKFLSPGEKTFDDNQLPRPDETLNVKNFYLVHPILYNHLGGSRKININKMIVIGDTKDWIDPDPVLPDWKKSMPQQPAIPTVHEPEIYANGSGGLNSSDSILTWLHLSDIHFNFENYETGLLRDKLYNYLKTFDTRFDFVVITGDMTYKNRNYTKETQILIENINQNFLKERGRIFIVPGNHDVYADNMVRVRLIEDIYTKSKDVSQYFNDSLKPEEYTCLIEAQEKFFEFYENINRRIGNRKKAYPRDALHFVETYKGYNIIHINTCLTCIGGKSDAGRIVLNQNKLREALKKIKDNGNINIAIGHHSIDWLNPHERDQFLNTLSDNRVQLYLCGHIHEPKCGFYVNNIKNINILGCGAFIQDDQSTAGIAIGKIDRVTGEGSVAFHKWSPKIEQWVIDPEVSREGSKGVIPFKISK
jgi:predicted MPP superfamily phosphohydrolase